MQPQQVELADPAHVPHNAHLRRCGGRDGGMRIFQVFRGALGSCDACSGVVRGEVCKLGGV